MDGKDTSCGFCNLKFKVKQVLLNQCSDTMELMHIIQHIMLKANMTAIKMRLQPCESQAV